jgi:hypothetical protein
MKQANATCTERNIRKIAQELDNAESHAAYTAGVTSVTVRARCTDTPVGLRVIPQDGAVVRASCAIYCGLDKIR